MATEAQPVTATSTETTTPVAAPAAIEKPAKAAPTATDTETTAAAAAAVVAAAHTPTRKLLGADEDDIPNDADLIEMSPRSLKSRLERFTKKALRDRFGTDSFDEIQTRLDQLEDYKKREEETKRAAMSEAERMKTDLAAAEARATKAEERAVAVHEARIVDKQDTRVTSIMSKFFDADYIEDEMPRLARFLLKCDDKQLRRASTIEKWCQERVEKKPKLAKDYDATKSAPVETAPALKAVPLNTGASPPRAGNAAPAGSALNRTAAPGKTNSMSESEWKSYKRTNGISY